MENPAHNEWRKENYPSNEGQIHRIARKAEKEISDYINEKLDSLANLNTSKKVAFLGLEDFLSIPEDLLEKDDDSDLSGANPNNFSGDATKDLSDDETGIQTTNNDEPVTIKPTIKEKSEVKEDKEVAIRNEGEATVTVGGDNDGGGGDEPGTDIGDTVEIGDISDEPKDSKTLVKVQLKVAAQKENDILYHNLIVSAEKDISSAELELLVSGDNDRDEGIEISFTDNGTVLGNKLKGITLSAGKNEIKIRFADNLKHSIKIKAYELQ